MKPIDHVLLATDKYRQHIARVEAELAQARETIVLMSEAALSQQQEIVRLREALKPFSYLAEVMGEGNMLNFRGVYVSTEQAQAAAAALKGPDHDA